MRILFHAVYYTPEVGGLESHVSALAEGLVRRGHEVRVVTSRSRTDLASEEEIAGVEVCRTWMPSRSTVGWALHAASSLGPMRASASWCDVVHAESFASVLPAGRAARLAGRPLVASLHTSHFLRVSESPLWRPLLRRIVRRADHTFAASEEIAAVATGLAPGTAVEALTNGVDTDRFVPGGGEAGEGPPTVVVPRRLFAKNGVEYMVRAVPDLVRRVPGVVVRIVGDGPERPELETLAEKLGVSESIIFSGSVPHEEMPAVLAAGHVAVLPSLMEATSVAALEAMACGLPVVATRVGGLPEIVDERVGRLVPPRDPRALSLAIAEVLSDPARAEKGHQARVRVVEQWSNERLVDRHLEVYEGLLTGRAARTIPTGGDR